jgi:ribonucleoside-diphosphate reductase subunit M1
MDHVDPVAITQKVISGVYGGVTTAQLDDLVRPLLKAALLLEYTPTNAFVLARPPRLPHT